MAFSPALATKSPQAAPTVNFGTFKASPTRIHYEATVIGANCGKKMPREQNSTGA
jgi:hypothetical protein